MRETLRISRVQEVVVKLETLGLIGFVCCHVFWMSKFRDYKETQYLRRNYINKILTTPSRKILGQGHTLQRGLYGLMVTRSNYFHRDFLVQQQSAVVVHLLWPSKRFNGLFAQPSRPWPNAVLQPDLQETVYSTAVPLPLSFNAILQWKIKHTPFQESFNRWGSAAASGPLMSKPLVRACEAAANC